MEVNACKKDQPFEIHSNPTSTSTSGSDGGTGREENAEVPMETDVGGSQTVSVTLA